MKLHFRHADEEHPVDVARESEGWRLTVREETVVLAAEREREGSWLVETPQGRRRLWVAARGDERFVHCDGRVVRLRLYDPDVDVDEAEAGGGPQLRARMPGKVVKVLVSEGDRVDAGQAMLVMESMKMETELTAGVAGVVQKILVTDGQVVGQDDPLIEIEPEPVSD